MSPLQRSVARRVVLNVAVLCCAACAHAPTAASRVVNFQQAFDRGLAAASKQQWDAAITSLTAAEGQVGYAGTTYPGLYLNLALAHAKAGHEATAIAWLYAYLAAAPDAPNANAVRAELKRLETALDAKAKLLFEEAVKAAAMIPADANRPLGNISTEMAKAGYVDWAVATYRPQLSGDDLDGQVARLRSDMVREQAEALIKADDVDAGTALVPQMTEPSSRTRFWTALGYYYLYTATPLDAARSRQALERIEDPAYRETHLNGTAARRQELQQMPPAATTTPTPVQAWSALARTHVGAYATLDQQLHELSHNTTRSAHDTATRLAELAAQSRTQLWKIRALEKHVAPPAATASASTP